MAALATLAVSLGLGGSFRQTLINEQFIVACWPLHEIASQRAKNIVRNRLHGFYGGANVTRGQVLGLPEGGIGALFGVTGYMEVADDSADAQTLNMSLSLGDFDIYFLFRTSTNDATLRCIAQKQETNTSGNGWRVGIQNGALVGFLRVSGVNIFTVTSGSGLADGNFHLGHLCYRPSVGRAEWFVDGVSSGSAVTGVTTEPQVTGGNLRLALHNDNTGQFLGTLGYVAIGREGNATLSTTLQTCRAWTALGRDVVADRGISLRYGIPGNGPTDRVASTGTLQFALDNSTRNSARLQGYYSPGHANCRAGFDLSIPVQLAFTYNGTTYYKFRGSIKSIQPMPWSRSKREVLVTCVDWMDVIADTLLADLETQIDRQSWEVFGEIVDRALKPPVNTNVAINSDVFAFALDNSKSESMSGLAEFQRITNSSFDKIFIQGDTSSGGLLRFQRRYDVQAVTPSAQFDNTMSALQFTYDRSAIVNIARPTYTPRTTGGSPVTLFDQQTTPLIRAGDTAVLGGAYTDPADPSAVRVGLNPTIAPTYAFTFNSAADGSGTDLTSSVLIVTDAGANSIEFTITNNSGVDGYVTQLSISGYPIYFYRPESPKYEDGDSVREHGPRKVDFEMPYQSDPDDAIAAARHVVESRKGRLSQVRSMRVFGDGDATRMTHVLAREVGHQIQLREAVITGSTYANFYIQEVALNVRPDGRIDATWALAPVNHVGGWWRLGTSALGTNTQLAWA